MIYMDMNICIYGIYGENLEKERKKSCVIEKIFNIYR